jgi:hypothetical protein
VRISVGTASNNTSNVREASRVAKIEALWKVIWKLEQDLGLLDRKIAGTFYWPIIRMRLVDLLSERLGLHELVHPRLRTSPTKHLKAALAPIYTDRGLSPNRISDRYDTILVPFLRKKRQSGRAIDIHTERILNDSELGRFLIIDEVKHDNFLTAPADADVKSKSNHMAHVLLRATAFAPTLLMPVMREHSMLNDALQRELGVYAPLSIAHFAMRLAIFIEGRKQARRFIPRSGARRLFFATSRGASAIAAAAQDVGLRSYEVQHGMIGRYHATYHYPGSPFVPYAPDALLLFGSYWGEAVDLPANTAKVVIGSGNLEKYQSQARRKTSKQVFVPSQGTIGRRLFEFTISAAKLAPEWNFVFKPHPAESLEMKNFIESDAQGTVKNFRILSPKDDIYEVLAASEVQVGVYSTALFEGMALGVRTIVVRLPGSEHMAAAVESGDAVFAQDPQEIARLLSSAPRALRADRYYAPPVLSILAALATANLT